MKSLRNDPRALKHSLVYVHWLDSAYSRDAEPDRFGPIELHTIGWLIRDDEEYVVLAMEYQPADNVYRDLVAIPHAVILSRRDQNYELASR